MGHSPSPRIASAHRSPAVVDVETARQVAETMQALATPSRVRILARLRDGGCSVTELAEAVGMEGSAVSHQLRLLRHLGLVVGRRRGRSVVYGLYDSHVADLLDQAVFHVEHVRLGLVERSPDEHRALEPGRRVVTGRRAS